MRGTPHVGKIRSLCSRVGDRMNEAPRLYLEGIGVLCCLRDMNLCCCCILAHIGQITYTVMIDHVYSNDRSRLL